MTRPRVPYGPTFPIWPQETRAIDTEKLTIKNVSAMVLTPFHP
jgi:hypothetical protein